MFALFQNLFQRRVVDFYGDFVDPFGYIGFYNLSKAAIECGIPIRWKGFELDPETPAEGYILQTAENSQLRAGMWASVATYAQKAGLTLQPLDFAPNTRLAQALVHFWRGPSTVKIPLIEAIYRAYLSERKNIGQESVLVEIARRFGASEKDCKEMLTRDAQKNLEMHRAEAEAYRFPGMPAYRFRNQTLFGALSTEEWRRVFNT